MLRVLQEPHQQVYRRYGDPKSPSHARPKPHRIARRSSVAACRCCAAARLSCRLGSRKSWLLLDQLGLDLQATDLESSQPPVSGAAFQVRPQSSRLTSGTAPEKPMRWLPQGSMPAPRNSTSTVTGRVTPRMVSSPSTFHSFSPAPGRTAVVRKLIVGCSSTPKKSLERMWASRVSSLVSTVDASISA